MRPQISNKILRSLGSSHPQIFNSFSTIRHRQTSVGERLQPQPIADQDPHEVAIHTIADVARHHQRTGRAAPCRVALAYGLHDDARYRCQRRLRALLTSRRPALLAVRSMAVRRHGPRCARSDADKLPSRRHSGTPIRQHLTAGFPSVHLGSMASNMALGQPGPAPRFRVIGHLRLIVHLLPMPVPDELAHK